MRQPLTQSESAPTRAATPVMARLGFPVWLMAVLLALVSIVLYWPATGHDFVNYDDDVYVTSNIYVQNGLTLEGIKWACFNPVCYNWHPLTVLSHMADCQLFGLKPWGHHLTSVLLHAVNTVLVFLLLRSLTGAIWRSVLVAALFGWHPLHVESVAWVAERKDVLSACFGLLALLFYGRYAGLRSPKSKVQSRGGCGHKPRITHHALRFILLSSLARLLRPRFAEQADAGHLAVRPVATRLLAAEPFSAFSLQPSIFNPEAIGDGENPVLCAGDGGERRDLRGAEAGRHSGVG